MACKKRFMLFCFLFILIAAQAQQQAMPLAKAENDFEELSHQLGLKRSFIQFADSAGYMFAKNGPVKAHDYWNKVPDKVPGFYNWYPNYIALSEGGDWGYTTGPSEYRAKSLNDTVSYYGQYTTIWHKNAAGNWKYLLDIGTDRPAKPMLREYVQIGPFANTPGLQRTAADLWLTDSFCNNAMNINRPLCYEVYASSICYLLNSNGHAAVSGKNNAVAMMENLGRLTFRRAGMMAAPSGYLAVIYGQVSNGKKESGYLRLWRLEKRGWQIAMEVLQL